MPGFVASRGGSNRLAWKVSPAQDWFLGFVMNGKLMDVEQNAPVEFELKNGRAVRMFARAVKGISDEPWIWATRRP